MTRQEVIEELQDKIRHNFISDIDELTKELRKYDYEGEEIDDFCEILSPLEMNFCDICGGIYRSDELIWVDYLDPEYDNELIHILDEENYNADAICDDCIKEIYKKFDVKK